MKIACVFGTRPEIIKLSPVIEGLLKSGEETLLVHTGQHYDYEMSDIFIKELELPSPTYYLGVRTEGSRRFAEIAGKLEEIFERERPDFVLVQGDTDTVPSTLFTARRLMIPCGHLEAGLRSFNMASPEELNRRLAAQLALVHFAPTRLNKEFLLAEGVNPSRIFVTGNTIVDVVKKMKKKLRTNILEEFGVSRGKPIVLVTVHRPGNVDRREKLERIFMALLRLEEFQLIFPMHPRTRKRAEEFGLLGRLLSAKHVRITKPLGFIDFLSLMAASDVLLTDSGGLQEEACELKKPVVVMRETTPRWEAVNAGFAFLVGTDEKRIEGTVRRILEDEELRRRLRKSKNPFGDGRTGERVVKILKRLDGKLGYEEPDKKTATRILERIGKRYGSKGGFVRYR